MQQLQAAAKHVIGADPYQIEALRVLIKSPRVFSTVEVALLDLIGKATGRSVTDLLGGPARRRVPFAAYLFYKEDGDDDWGPALTPEELVVQAERFATSYGMTVFKLKGGVLEPDAEVRTLQLLRERFGPAARLRIDPNAAWSVETSLRVAKQLARRRRRVPGGPDRRDRRDGRGRPAHADPAQHQHVRHRVRTHPGGLPSARGTGGAR